MKPIVVYLEFHPKHIAIAILIHPFYDNLYPVAILHSCRHIYNSYLFVFHQPYIAIFSLAS